MGSMLVAAPPPPSTPSMPTLMGLIHHVPLLSFMLNDKMTPTAGFRINGETAVCSPLPPCTLF